MSDDFDGLFVIIAIFAGPLGWLILALWLVLGAASAATTVFKPPRISSRPRPEEIEERRERIRQAFGRPH